MVASTTKYDYIYCDPIKCVGCQLCEYVCSFTKTGEYNSYRSRIRTVRVDEVLMTSIACRTCENAPCVVVCPRDAWCVEACDFGAISINPATKLAEICDQCENEEGGPQCVKWCPKEALSLTNPDRISQKSRRELIKESLEFPMKAKDPR